MVMTLEADYAVRIVEYLTRHPGRWDARTISEAMDVPLRFCLKILRGLVAQGMVCSFKGAKGGYSLSRPAGEITLREVIESVEGGVHALPAARRRSTAAAGPTASSTRFTRRSPRTSAGSWTRTPSR